MLDEHEWPVVHAELTAATRKVQEYRETYGVGLTETPTASMFAGALQAYERITGFRETNPNALWHHRVALYGPPCHRCNRPLRTPKARLCGSCMAPRETV
jgi:hypothetical protein